MFYFHEKLKYKKKCFTPTKYSMDFKVEQECALRTSDLFLPRHSENLIKVNQHRKIKEC